MIWYNHYVYVDLIGNKWVSVKPLYVLDCIFIILLSRPTEEVYNLGKKVFDNTEKLPTP